MMRGNLVLSFSITGTLSLWPPPKKKIDGDNNKRIGQGGGEGHEPAVHGSADIRDCPRVLVALLRLKMK